MAKYPNLHKYGIKFVEDGEQVLQAMPFLETWKVVGVDTETTSLDPHTGRLRLVQIANKTDRYVFDTWRIGQQAKEALRDYLMDQQRLKILHNAKFDKKFLQVHLGVTDFYRLVCTKVLSQILAFGNESQLHNLKSVLERYLSVGVDKEEQTSDWSQEHLTESQVIYAATDTMHLIELWEVMHAVVKQYGLEHIYKIEMEAVEPTAEMELNGFRLDYDAWVARADDDERECKEAEWQIYETCDVVSKQQSLFAEPEVFNINSQKQLRPKLKALGITLPTKTERDGMVKETTGKDQLAEIEHVHPVIGLLIKQKVLHKAYTSYGRNWSHCINPKTGRVHANLNQVGTMTGRYTTREGAAKRESDKMEPPLLGIPRDIKYRRCFVAGPGNVLVWGDYAAEELRIIAELSGEPVLIDAFIQDIDPHLNAAMTVLGKLAEEISKKERDLFKDLNYGLVYGVGARRFAQKALMEESVARALISKYFKKQPRLKAWLDDAGWRAVKYRQARTMSGRLVKFNFNESDSNSVALAQRNGKNTPIQGTGADILKVALGALYDYTRGLPIMMCHSAHDEAITECPKENEEQAKEILTDAMMYGGQYFLKTVPVKVDIKSGPHWQK